MGGKVWSIDEERIFWTRVVPQSVGAAVPIAQPMGWPECAQMMQTLMGDEARRTYTHSMLCEYPGRPIDISNSLQTSTTISASIFRLNPPKPGRLSSNGSEAEVPRQRFVLASSTDEPQRNMSTKTTTIQPAPRHRPSLPKKTRIRTATTKSLSSWPTIPPPSDTSKLRVSSAAEPSVQLLLFPRALLLSILPLLVPPCLRLLCSTAILGPAPKR